MDWIALALGLLIGALLGWLLKPKRAGDASGQIEELRQQIRRETEVRDQLQVQLSRTQEARGAAEAHLEAQANQLQQLQTKVAQLDVLQQERASLQAKLDAAKDLAQQKEAEFQARIQHSEAQQALQTKKLMEELQEKQRISLEKQREAWAKEDQLVAEARSKAFKEDVKRIEDWIKETEKERAKGAKGFEDQFKAILEQSDAIQKEARTLTKSLQNVTVQGRFGEMALERVLEHSGLSKGIHYETQAHQSTEEGAIRPDVVVNLPGGARVIIDSKAPMNAFHDSLEAETETTRKAKIQEHGKAVRGHVKVLASKSYHEAFAKDGTQPYTVLFLPSDSSYLAAVEGDPELVEFAAKNNVLIATAATIVGLLKTVKVGYQRLEAQQESEQILKLAKDVYDRGFKIIEESERIGRALGTATKAYNTMVSSYESRYLPAGRQLAKFLENPKELKEAPSTLPEPTSIVPEKLDEGQQLLN